MLALLLLYGCGQRCEPSPEIPGDGIDQDCDGGDPSGAFREIRRIEGAPDLGFGHAVAWWGDDVAVGAPLGESPGVWLGGERVISGPSDSFTGSALTDEWVSAPRDGFGRVRDRDGGVIWEGQGPTPGGGHAIRHGGQVASVRSDGVVVDTELFSTPERLVSLLSADLGAGPELVGGLLSGGLWTSARVINGERELGRGLAACDLDSDGDDDLVVGLPASDEVRLYVIDSLSELDLELPTASLHTPEGRGGQTVVCAGSAVVVGAPQAGGGAGWVGWFEAPLHLDLPVAVREGERRESLGFALAVSADGILAASAPGEGRVYVLSTR